MDEIENTANEPIPNYGSQGLSFEKVWLMFQETDKEFRKTKQLMDENARRSKEMDKKLDRKLDKLAKMYGGVSENNGAVAEEFFKRGLEKHSNLFGIEYNQVGTLQKKTKQLQGQYDIVLYNGDAMVIIEVKYKLHPSDVEDFYQRKLPNFRPLYPEYSDKVVIGAVAGLSVPNDSIELAQKFGFLVLTQSGENITVVNPEGFMPAKF